MTPIVIKYGGSLLEDPAHQEVLLREVQRLSDVATVVLVHGGGKEITQAMELAGLVTRFVDGRRYTDDLTMQVVERTLANINARIVASLRTLGANAAGFSGRTRRLMRAQALPELGRVGESLVVRKEVLRNLLFKQKVSVFYTVAEDAQGDPLNVNADDFALALAVALKTDRLVFLTDTGGILDKAQKALSRLHPAEVEALIQDGTITGGMAVKARVCVKALGHGVGRVEILKDPKALDPAAATSDGTTFTN